MVAIDQRESLRTLLQATRAPKVSDEHVQEFKVAVAQTLAPFASAMLFDTQFAMPALRAARKANPACGLIVAADRLLQDAGAPVTDTEIDLDVDPEHVRAMGAVAMKLLLLWKGPESSERCLDLATKFMERCHAFGLIGIIEAMVRQPAEAPAWDHEVEIIAAARALAASRPDLYKGEVPFLGRGAPGEIRAVSEAITEAIGCPWVVLSQGVEIDDFPRSVEAACRGGASGFLAGRAIWADSLSDDDYRARLGSASAPRLMSLSRLVDRVAYPWHLAGTTSA
jgi:sulfofructosephosphate aldolase